MLKSTHSQTLDFHPVFLEKKIPELERSQVCISATIPLDFDNNDPKNTMLNVRSVLRSAREKFNDRAGLHPKFNANQRSLIEQHLSELENLDENALRALNHNQSLAVFVTPEQSILMGLPEQVHSMAMVSDHPYALPLMESSKHFYQRYYYLVDLSMNSLKLYRIEDNGEIDTLLDRDMDELDFRPAANYEDNHDEPLQFHGSGSGNQAIYHGHSAQDNRHFEERQKRFWRDAYEEVQTILGMSHRSSSIPVVLRGEQRQRDAFIDKVNANDEQFDMQTNLQHKGSLKEQFEMIRNELYHKANRHKNLLRRWKRARSQGLTETHTPQIARLVAQGMVDTLVISNKETLWGEYDAKSGDLLIHQNERMSSGEVRDLLARRVQELGGDIHVLSHDEMPSKEPFAAILRGTVA